MELDKCIKERRSVRDYLDKEVDLDKIMEVIESASYAPSAGNVQNWSFIVIKDKKRKTDISTACLKQYWMIDAPVHMVVCNKLEKIKRFYGIKGEQIYSSQACSAAIENMLLKAHDIGLGTCWVGAFDENALHRALKIPEDIRIEGVITIGYSKIQEQQPYRKPLERMTYFEEWDKKEIDHSLWPLAKHKKTIAEALKKLLKK